ncbi:uncharacterized protein LOC126777716 [Nymphalis io]|uniref:uncharacterized protein LOC126777716 n=1 Tax=Inachis io TaxID=171585 RepID=UPI002169DF0E|nr:uncharacterized protein LOC126777716 [Nymphalis io]
MVGYYMILVLGCSGAVMGDAPPYVQSYEAFVASKTYVSEKLPVRKMDIHKAEDRIHLSFAMLTGVTGGLVLLQDKDIHSKTPLEIVDEFVPLVWQAYGRVSDKAQSLLNEANHKVALIVNLINTVCGSASIKECNAEVDRRVKESPFTYQLPADLLLSLGKLSVVIRDNQSTINSIIENDNDIPYLIHNIESKQFGELLKLIRKVNNDMTQLTYRRFLNNA